MIGFTAFKTRKPRAFDYRPRYYNPEQEAREQRKHEILGDQQTETAPDQEKAYKPGQYIGALRMRRGVIANRNQERRKSNLIRVVIFLLLGLVALWYIFS